MAKMPPIPPEQRSFRDDAAARLDSARPDRREPADKDIDTDHQGQSGNLRQNLTPQRSVQDR